MPTSQPSSQDLWEGWWQGDNFGWQEPEPAEDLSLAGGSADIQGLADMKCHVCGGMGHLARNCPTPNPKGGGKGGREGGGRGGNGGPKGGGKGGKGCKEQQSSLHHLWQIGAPQRSLLGHVPRPPEKKEDPGSRGGTSGSTTGWNSNCYDRRVWV